MTGAARAALDAICGSFGTNVSGRTSPGRKVEEEMKLILMAFVAVLAGSAFALADTPVSPAEAEKIKAALDALGCSGGKMEKETEGSSVFEIDDAKCRDGQFDIKLDKDFKLIVMTRD